jgi:hypothetical protein
MMEWPYAISAKRDPVASGDVTGSMDESGILIRDVCIKQN